MRCPAERSIAVYTPIPLMESDGSFVWTAVFGFSIRSGYIDEGTCHSLKKI